MENQTEINVIWESLGIANDFIFGKVMQDAGLPDLEIDHIEYPETQKGIRPDVDAKSVRLDVYVKDGKGTVYDIELQAADTKELPKRSRYYQSMLDLQLIDKGQTYKKLKPSYVIFICPFDLLAKGGIFIALRISAKRTTAYFWMTER